MPAISVLLPCYNAADTLPEALESLARQTWPDFEIIAVDDGSTDGTRSLLEAWCRQDNRLRIIPQAHAGILGALNTGLAACQGEYVARMDADDRALPERLQRQAALLDARPEVAVVGCRVSAFPVDLVREGFRVYLEWQNSLLSEEEIRREMFVESPLAHPSVMFRRAVVLAAGGYQERGWPEDYDLWLRLYLAGAHFSKLPEVLLEWRERPTRLTRTDSRYTLENFLRAKAYYLARGPLADRQAVFIWGAGMMGRRLGKQLERQNVALEAYFDIDPRKSGRTRRGRPVLPPQRLAGAWAGALTTGRRPVILAAVGARGARPLIRARFRGYGLVEAQDWWFAA